MIDKSKISLSNLILVSGNGRNSGKTLFVRNLIQYLAKTNPVSAVKISPHFHSINSESIIYSAEKFVICEEKEINSKDSSLMLQAGAEKVFFMMVKQENLKEAFVQLQDLFSNSLVICESGGLHQVVNPGIHFFVKEKRTEIVKHIPGNVNPIIVQRENDLFDFKIQNIHFQNSKLYLANESVC